MFTTPIRALFTMALAIAMALTAGACGGSDEVASAATGVTGGAGANAEVDIGGVTTCLVNRGFDVTREADQDAALVLPDEYKASVGLIESVSLGSIGDVRGVGSIGFFNGAGAAEEDFEASSSFRGGDELAGVIGNQSWSYLVTSGDDPGVEQMVRACLG